jgi:hypothetical protein
LNGCEVVDFELQPINVVQKESRRRTKIQKHEEEHDKNNQEEQ